MRLLASDQEAEAEAARRKLLRHLAQYGVTLNDLSAHLGEVHDTHAAAAPDVLRHALARAQRAEAAQRGAEEMNVRLLSSLEALRRRVQTARVAFGVLAGVGVVVGGALLGLQVWRAKEPAAVVQQIAPRVSDAVTNPSGAPAPAAGDTGAHHPGEWIGTVQESAELLDDPDSAAQRRAMLGAGARVLVLQSGPVWLRVRTERGDGYVLKGLVRADR